MANAFIEKNLPVLQALRHGSAPKRDGHAPSCQTAVCRVMTTKKKPTSRSAC